MILKKFELGFQWPVQEPFLFCVHHLDEYPAGEKNFGPAKKFLSGREIGQDFVPKDGFRMYHGDVVPGFPVHPHRGFETITIVRKGYVDHADSLGAAGRYGEGDVQWMTAGEGVQHSEMFPLLKSDDKNTLELFQIWLNLPAKNKMVSPHFTMFWSKKIPQIMIDAGKVEISLIAGEFMNQKALPPPPDSWAADENNETLILLVKMQAGSKMQLPKAKSTVHRALYFFEGTELSLENTKLGGGAGYALDATKSAELVAGAFSQFLILQSKPINEPIVQYGPFVMNSKEQIQQAFQDYQTTQFGGWPWPTDDVVHGPEIQKFAKYPDGRVEKPD